MLCYFWKPPARSPPLLEVLEIPLFQNHASSRSRKDTSRSARASETPATSFGKPTGCQKHGNALPAALPFELRNSNFRAWYCYRIMRIRPFYLLDDQSTEPCASSQPSQNDAFGRHAAALLGNGEQTHRLNVVGRRYSAVPDNVSSRRQAVLVVDFQPTAQQLLHGTGYAFIKAQL